jgi:hypothetical protein
MTPKEYWKMTKLEWFLDGFGNIKYAWYCYTNWHPCVSDDFWEAISWGWMAEYIFPYDDPYNPYLSPERKLRLGKW